jgi:hypothetical protein
VKRTTYILLALLLPVLLPAGAFAAESGEPIIVPSPVIITELQTGSASGSDEFIELSNVSEEVVDITGWQLRYTNATSTGDGTTLVAEIGGHEDAAVMLEPGEHYLVHTQSIVVQEGMPGQIFNATLSSADKTVGLFAANLQSCLLEVADAVAWGVGSKGEGPAVVVAGKGDRWLQRLRLADGYIDTGNNAFDFRGQAVVNGAAVPTVTEGASPGFANPLAQVDVQLPPDGHVSSLTPLPIQDCTLPEEDDPEPPLEPPLPPPATEPPATVEPDAGTPDKTLMPVRNTGLASPQLSELLPNPAKPQLDATDEFVELYNSNGATFELSRFILESGKKRYVFPQGTLIEGKSFKAFFAAETRLALSNTQGSVRLLDPLGRVISQADPYQNAKDGLAWVRAAGSWQWSASPTPHAANVVKAPATGKKTTKKASVKSSGTAQAISPKTKELHQESTASLSDRTEQQSRLHTGVLAIGGALAVLYGAYEYRRDMANKLYQLRAHRAARRQARQSTEGK